MDQNEHPKKWCCPGLLRIRIISCHSARARARAGAGAGTRALAWASASATASSCTRRLFSVTLFPGSTPVFDMDIKFKFL